MLPFEAKRSSPPMLWREAKPSVEVIAEIVKQVQHGGARTQIMYAQT